MKFKKGFQLGLGFGVMMFIWNVVSSLIFREDVSSYSFVKHIISALIGGLVGGLIFGFLMNWFYNSKLLQPRPHFDLQPGETLLFETNANHFKGWEGVGGYLYLTIQNLVYKSHSFNIQKHNLIIPLADIAEVIRYKTRFFTNNGLVVITKGGNKEKFVVDQPTEWLEQLTTSQIGMAAS